MGTRNRPTPTADRLTVAKLQGAADRLGGWEEPVGQERQVAVQDLRDIGRDNTAAYAESAGIMLGCHPPEDVSHDRYRVAAELLLEAGGLTVDDPDVQQWIAVGEWRRTRTRAAMAAGDTFDRAFRSSDPIEP